MSYADFSAKNLADLISLRGRTAVVTGGGQGLGRAIARRLAEAGANVLVGDLNDANAQQTAIELQRYGGKHKGVPLDVRNHASITALADLAIKETGRLDIWVNNAGIYPSRAVLDISDEDWDQLIDINLRGTFFGAREAALRMQPNRGVIVNLASTAGYDCSNGVNPAHYVASKHGVIGLIKSLAVELGPKGIRVVGVAPTMTETPGVAAVRSKGAEIAEALVQYATALPLGRAGVPDDIARVVLFLASDMAGFVTGSVIPVDGGDLAR